MTLDPVIRLESVSKHYGQNVALDEFSLEVPPGVVLALLGENGAGKTTAIRILMGLTEPDAGRAHVLGLDSQRDDVAIRQRVGYVAERPALDEWMSVREVGWFAAGFHAAGFLDNYLRHVAAFDVQADKIIRQLSKGMRSKVALSLALAHDPPLLVLDEPTSGLDAMVRREFLESMVDFTADGKTVLLSSHQIHEVERVADIIAILRRGRLLCCRRLDDLKLHTTQAIVTLTDEQASCEWPGPVLMSQRRGRQCQLTVAADQATTQTLLADLPRVDQCEVRRPTLEEIFIAYMKSAPDLAAAIGDMSDEPAGDIGAEVQP
jgi:ABC-2 type transport system ATP-binding protein